MAWCACFKTQQPEDGQQRKSGNRQSIRADRNELDLLELNKRGMEASDEPWMDSTSNDDQRVSNNTELMQSRQRDSSCEKAIEEFMRSPRASQNNPKLSIKKSPTVMTSGNTKNGLAKQQSAGPNNSFKKTGVCVSKCYQMLCGRCGRRFTKIMTLEQSIETEPVTAFDVQAYFNSTQNHDYECPFCFQKAQIILSEQMLVGDTMQLDYQKTLDKASNAERITLARQMGLTSSLTANSLGPSTTAASDNISQEPQLIDEIIETRPQLLYTKFQRLKNTTKLAKVILVDEIPQVRSPRQNQTQASTDMPQPDGSELAPSQDEARREVARSGQFDKNAPQSSKALLYYPEDQHTPNEQACNAFNSRIMKHLMKQKMQKNDTFYVAKVLKGDNNFLRRQTQGKSPLTGARMQLRNSQAVYNSQSKNVAGPTEQRDSKKVQELMKSMPDRAQNPLQLSDNEALDNSRLRANNHTSTNMAVDQSYMAPRPGAN